MDKKNERFGTVCQSATRNDEDDDDQMGDGNESRSKNKERKSKMKYFAFLMINCIFLSSATTRDKS